jgi:divalent metal cation (Fe/Co/Zn/Cd) transporter
MLLSTRLIRTVDLNKYPSGKSRMEPTGVVVFSCIMGMSAVVLLVESAQQLVDDLSAHTPRVFIDHVSIALIAIDRKSVV